MRGFPPRQSPRAAGKEKLDPAGLRGYNDDMNYGGELPSIRNVIWRSWKL